MERICYLITNGLRWRRVCLGLLVLFLLREAPAFDERVEVSPIGRDVIETRLRQFSGKNAERKENLRRLFEEAGCPDVADQPVKHTRVPNVICTSPGATDSVIIVGAHFDYAGNGEGVVDNWTGAALLPSLFESLHGLTRQHTFVFVGFTDEEKGLIGSEFYAKHLTPEQKLKTRAMVNLDSLGLSATKVWYSRADKKLVAALDRVAQTLKLSLEGVNVDQVGSSDSESFARRKIPSITIHSVTQETWPILHSNRDNLEAVRLDDYYDTFRLLSFYLAFLDTTLE